MKRADGFCSFSIAGRLGYEGLAFKREKSEEEGGYKNQ